MAVLLGRTSAGTAADFASQDRTSAWPFVAGLSGNLTHIFAQTKVANAGEQSALRLGIYADNGSGRPGALHAVVSSTIGDPATSGVFGGVLGTPVPIVAGTAYHLSLFAFGGNLDFQGTTNTGAAYVETSALADHPDPFGLFTGPHNVEIIIWGEEIIPPTSMEPIGFVERGDGFSALGRGLGPF